MRGGVCCHRGRSAASVSDSGPRDGALDENVHAEVRRRGAFGGAVRSDDEAAEKRHRMGLLEAIEAMGGE